MGLASTATLLPKMVPNKEFLGSFSQFLYKRGNDLIHGTEYEGLTIADIEEGNRENRRSGTGTLFFQTEFHSMLTLSGLEGHVEVIITP